MHILALSPVFWVVVVPMLKLAGILLGLRLLARWVGKIIAGLKNLDK